MNKSDKLAIAKHALHMLKFWKDLNQEAEEAVLAPYWRAGRCSSWYKLEQRQAYHDSLLSLRNCGLIESYDCSVPRVQIDGKWYTFDDLPKIRFRKTGKSIPVN